MKGLLENPNEPVNDFSYFDCLESVMDNSKKLGESLSGISQHAKNSKLEDFGDSVTNSSKALCGLTEAAAQVLDCHVCRPMLSVGFHVICNSFYSSDQRLCSDGNANSLLAPLDVCLTGGLGFD